MATILTYAQLKKDIPEYCNRKDLYFIGKIDTFISFAQRRIADDTQMLGLKIVAQGNLIVGNSYVAKDARWLKTSSFEIGYNETPYETGFKQSKNLYNRQDTYCDTYWPDKTKTGLPEFYADPEYQPLLVVPTPDQNYPYKWSYYQIPELIDDVTQQNYITAYKPHMLTYASLVEAFGYLKDKELGDYWEGRYQQSLQTTAQQDASRLNDQQDVRA